MILPSLSFISVILTNLPALLRSNATHLHNVLLYSSIQLIALKHGSNLGGSVLLRLSCVTYWLWHQNTSKLIICKAAVIRVAIWDSGTGFKFGTCEQDSNTGAKKCQMDLPNFINQFCVQKQFPTLIFKAGITIRKVRVLTFEGVKNSSNWVISIFELWLLRRSDSLYKIALVHLVPSNATETTFGKFSLKSAILQEIQE